MHNTLAEVSTSAESEFFPRSIWTDMLACDKSNPELCRARVNVSSNLPCQKRLHLVQQHEPT